MGETVTLRGRKKLYIFVEEAISTEHFSSFFRGGGSRTHSHTPKCTQTHTVVTQYTPLLLQSKKKTPENRMFNLYLLCTTLTTLEGQKESLAVVTLCFNSRILICCEISTKQLLSGTTISINPPTPPPRFPSHACWWIMVLYPLERRLHEARSVENRGRVTTDTSATSVLSPHQKSERSGIHASVRQRLMVLTHFTWQENVWCHNTSLCIFAPWVWVGMWFNGFMSFVSMSSAYGNLLLMCKCVCVCACVQVLVLKVSVFGD